MQLVEPIRTEVEIPLEGVFFSVSGLRSFLSMCRRIDLSEAVYF